MIWLSEINGTRWFWELLLNGAFVCQSKRIQAPDETRQHWRSRELLLNGAFVCQSGRIQALDKTRQRWGGERFVHEGWSHGEGPQARKLGP